ncbi:hypothetical protein ACFOHS_04930 [Jhaorihella thermophila]
MQAAAIAAVCLAFGAVLYMTMERRRALAEANAELEQRVEARTRELSDTNRRLLREIEERHEAEAALRRAQAELVQAGKLSALGQMSAGISHELNQPLMAIQQFAEKRRGAVGKGGGWRRPREIWTGSRSWRRGRRGSSATCAPLPATRRSRRRGSIWWRW